MPLYTYTGCECAERFEVFQKMRESALTDCPDCRQPVRRVLSRVRFAFAKSPEDPGKTVRDSYEMQLGRKVEKDEQFYTVPDSGEVVPLKGKSRQHQDDAIIAAYGRAGVEVKTFERIRK
jgi:putative FmdB family regulatory protein